MNSRELHRRLDRLTAVVDPQLLLACVDALEDGKEPPTDNAVVINQAQQLLADLREMTRRTMPDKPDDAG